MTSTHKFEIGDRVKITSNPNQNTIYQVADIGSNGIYGVILPKGKNIIAVHESEMCKVNY